MTHFKRSTVAQGLEIYPDTTKILTSQSQRDRKKSIDEILVEILPPEGKAKYLGQMIYFIHGSRNYQNTALNALYLVRVRQTSAVIDIQILPAQAQVSHRQ